MYSTVSWFPKLGDSVHSDTELNVKTALWSHQAVGYRRPCSGGSLRKPVFERLGRIKETSDFVVQRNWLPLPPSFPSFHPSRELSAQPILLLRSVVRFGSPHFIADRSDPLPERDRLVNCCPESSPPAQHVDPPHQSVFRVTAFLTLFSMYNDSILFWWVGLQYVSWISQLPSLPECPL